jgi:hypothetical protein
MIQFIVIKWRKSNKRQVGQFPKESKKKTNSKPSNTTLNSNNNINVDIEFNTFLE